jgi:HEAT repeat protein
LATVPCLRAAASDKSWKVRLAAATSLSALSRPDGFKALCDLVSDPSARATAGGLLTDLYPDESKAFFAGFVKVNPDEDIRACALIGLARLGVPEGISGVVEMLKSKRHLVAAVTVADDAGIKEAIPELLKLSNVTNEQPRLSIAIALAKMGSNEAIPILIALLNGANWYVANDASKALARMDAKEAIPELIKLLKMLKLKNDEWSTSISIHVQALGRLRAKEAIPELVELLDDRQYRSSAISALQLIADKSASPALMKLVKNNDHDALQAAKAPALAGEKVGVTRLVETMNDKDNENRCSAALYLGQVGAKEAIPDLIKCLDDGHRDVRSCSAQALGLLQAKEARQEVTALLKDEDPRVRMSAAIALGRIGDKEAAPEIAQLLKDSDTDTINEAAIALGILNARETLNELIALRNRDDSRCRPGLAMALVRLGAVDSVPKSAIKDLKYGFWWYASDVEAMAEEALKALGVSDHQIHVLKFNKRYPN